MLRIHSINVKATIFISEPTSSLVFGAFREIHFLSAFFKGGIMETTIYDRSKERKGICRKRLAAWFLTLIIAVAAAASSPCMVFAEGTQGGTADTISLAAATSIAKATVTGLKCRTWTGKALTQKPVVKLGSRTLKAGTDYKISYKSNINVGRATMIIRGRGKYTGTITKTFIIKPKPTALTLLKRNGSIMTVCWKRQSKQTSGYQITYSGARYPHLSPNLNRVRIKNARATTHKIKISSTAYRYRVWIRTYKKVGSNYYFSDWSEYFSIWRDGTLER